VKYVFSILTAFGLVSGSFSYGETDVPRQLQFEFKIFRGGKLVSAPKIIAMAGQESTISQETESSLLELKVYIKSEHIDSHGALVTLKLIDIAIDHDNELDTEVRVDFNKEVNVSFVDVDGTNNSEEHSRLMLKLIN
jgi:hypothetical protein